MFQTILSKLAARTGARWAMIVGGDGVLLETHDPAFRAEAETLAAEFAACLRSARRAAGDTEMGSLQSAQLVTDRGKLLFQPLSKDYFIALLLKPESLAGRAQFEISRSAGPLQEELVY